MTTGDREYGGYHVKGLRLAEGLDPLLCQPPAPVGMSLPEALVWYDKAQGLMLIEEALIPRHAGVACLRELEVMGTDRTLAPDMPPMLSLLHSGERELIRRLGAEVGGHIHVGRSTQDLINTTFRMAMRSALLDVAAACLSYRAGLLEVASRHLETIIPSFTHQRIAQPTTLGSQLLGYANAAERDFDRLMHVYATVNVSPAGACAGTAAPFVVNRERLAELLGFESVTPNTYATIATFDHIWEFVAVLSLCAGTLGSVADYLLFLCDPARDYLHFADRWMFTSSSMPHKSNPMSLEVVSRLATEVSASPVAHRRWDPPDVLPNAAKVRWGFRVLHGTVRSLQARTDRMMEDCKQSWGFSADLAAAIVRQCGLSWRAAHEIVGVLTRQALEARVAPAQIRSSLLDQAASTCGVEPLGLDDDLIQLALDPVRSVAGRTTTGGPAPSEMRRQLERCRTLYAEHERWYARRAEAVDNARTATQRAVEAAIGVGAGRAG